MKYKLGQEVMGIQIGHGAIRINKVKIIACKLHETQNGFTCIRYTVKPVDRDLIEDKEESYTKREIDLYECYASAYNTLQHLMKILPIPNVED